MTTCAHSNLPSRHSGGDGEDGVRRFRERIQLLLELELFREALAEVQRFQNWKCDPECLRQFGLVLHRFAPRSRDRSYAYSVARVMYRAAVARTHDRPLRAEALADIGASYFEDGRLDEAVNAFEASRSLAPWMHRSHLGLLAIACARRDLAAIRRRCEAFVAAIPDWHEHREAVALLAADSDFAFLRASPELFFACFGSSPDQLVALHDQDGLEALEHALATFETREDEEPEGTFEFEGAFELTRVVCDTAKSVALLLRGQEVGTLRDVPVESLQARIGFP
jgi:tetratricopeptide (TPR) repeat protein